MTLVGRGLISEEIINQIKDRVDIVDIVAQHVSMTKADQNLKGRCPFHQDKTPSFTVSPSKQIFHCFGCGAGGNVFTFLTRITGANFPEVVRDLGRKAGIDVQETAGQSGPFAAQTARVESLNQAVVGWFRQNLNDPKLGEEARAYLVGRGMTDATLDRFAVGFAPSEWDGLSKALVKQGFTAAELAMAGLTVPREQGTTGFYDRFRARVMFPITDLRKRVVGFGGRIPRRGDPEVPEFAGYSLVQEGADALRVGSCAGSGRPAEDRDRSGGIF